MDQVLRSYSATIEDVDKRDRSIVAKIGVDSVDRYNTVILPRGIKLTDFIENPVVLFEHGRDVNRGALPIGVNLWTRIEKSGRERLIAKTRFHSDSFSQTLWELYEQQCMRGWSVSILPTDFGPPRAEEIRARPELKNVDCIYRASSLMEYSCVAVPGCQDALTIDEMRSLSRVISRGIPVPIDIKSLVEKAMTEGGGMSTGGALVEPETVDENCGPKDKPKKRKKPKSDDDTDDDGDDDDADDDDAVDEGITVAGGGMMAVGASADDAETVTRDAPEPEPVVEPDPVIELPPLTGRTFEEIVAAHILEERHFRHEMKRKFEEHKEWLQGIA